MDRKLSLEPRLGKHTILCILLITSLYHWTWLIDSSHNNYPLYHPVLHMHEDRIPRWLKLTSMLNYQVLDWMPNTEHSRCWTSYSDVLYYSRSNLAVEIAFFQESNLAEVHSFLSIWFPCILEIKRISQHLQLAWEMFGEKCFWLKEPFPKTPYNTFMSLTPISNRLVLTTMLST